MFLYLGNEGFYFLDQNLIARLFVHFDMFDKAPVKLHMIGHTVKSAFISSSESSLRSALFVLSS
jgi:hypothetical protein